MFDISNELSRDQHHQIQKLAETLQL